MWRIYAMIMPFCFSESVRLSVAWSPYIKMRFYKKKTKQFRAMVSIDDQ